MAALLLEHAEILEFDDFRTCTRRWELLADENGAHHDRDTTNENRNATALAVGSGIDLRTTGGDAVTAAELVAIFNAFTQAEFDRDHTARAAEFGTDTAGQPFARTSAQRRHDAIIEIFRRAANAPDGTGRRANITVNIVVDERTFTEALIAHTLAPASALDHVADPGPAQRRCETTAGTPVHPDDILTATIHGHIRRVIYDSAGVVTNLGRRRRLFTGSARQAAQLSARRCTRPGCTIPTELCDIDHTHEHHNGGTTDTNNANPQCSTHNRQKNHGYTTTRNPNTGHITHHRPNGTPIQPARPPTPPPAPDPDPP